MTKWCGMQKSTQTNKYRIVVPMVNDFIHDDMMIDSNIGGKILTKWLDLDDAKEACKEFNMLHVKYN